MIYWDNNATTRLAPEALEAMRPYLEEEFYNPSASYPQARRVRAAVEEARETVAALLGVHADEILFTSGATEATHSALAQFSSFITTATEHPATMRMAQQEGAELCPVLSSGIVDVAAWSKLLQGHDGASFAFVNHETGVIQPVEKLSDAALRAGARVHLDAVQAAGKIPFSLHDWEGVDFASVSAHKLHGPKGIGALYVRRGAAFRPLMLGGSQESGRRAGTENVPGIIGFGVAAGLAVEALKNRPRFYAGLRERFLSHLRSAGLEPVEQGAEAPRVPHVVSLRVPGCSSEALRLLLEVEGLLCSAGSACTSFEPEASHVLRAMGLSDTEARETLRLSWNRFCSEAETDAAADIFIACVRKLRSVQGMHTGPVVVYTPEHE